MLLCCIIRIGNVMEVRWRTWDIIGQCSVCERFRFAVSRTIHDDNGAKVEYSIILDSDMMTITFCSITWLSVTFVFLLSKLYLVDSFNLREQRKHYETFILRWHITKIAAWGNTIFFNSLRYYFKKVRSKFILNNIS